MIAHSQNRQKSSPLNSLRQPSKSNIRSASVFPIAASDEERVSQDSRFPQDSASCSKKLEKSLYFGDLPGEIIRAIAAMCAPSCAAALRVTCHDLYILLDRSDLGGFERQILRKKLAKDRFEILCVNEQNGIISSTYRACVGCKDGHRLKVFSAEQLEKPSTERICIGLERKMPICEHMQISFHELQSYARSCIYKDGAMRICGKGSGWLKCFKGSCNRPWLVFGPFEPTLSWSVPLNNAAEIVDGITLSNNPQDTFRTETEILDDTPVEMVTGVSWMILMSAWLANLRTCPHLHWGFDIPVWRVLRLLATRGKLKRNNVMFATPKTPLRSCSDRLKCQRHPGSGPCKALAEWKCKHEGCNIIFAVYGKDSHNTYIAVRRSLGRIDDAVNPEWLSHLRDFPQSFTSAVPGFRKYTLNWSVKNLFKDPKLRPKIYSWE